ncbi:MAG: hypothetical protein ACPGUV_04550 [Polyangiales bacterium]
MLDDDDLAWLWQVRGPRLHYNRAAVEDEDWPPLLSGHMTTWGYAAPDVHVQTPSWSALAYALDTARSLADIARRAGLCRSSDADVDFEAFVAPMGEGTDLSTRLRRALGMVEGEWIVLTTPNANPFLAHIDDDEVDACFTLEEREAYDQMAGPMRQRLRHVMTITCDPEEQGAPAYLVSPELWVGEGPGGHLVGLWAHTFRTQWGSRPNRLGRPRGASDLLRTGAAFLLRLSGGRGLAVRMNGEDGRGAALDQVALAGGTGAAMFALTVAPGL